MRKNNKQKKYNKKLHNINEDIRTNEVRLVGENVPNSGDVVPTTIAMGLANELELDLVEITPNAEPPVVKILDYKKFLYEEKKRKKEQEKRQKDANKTVKEVRLSLNISDNDLNTKKKKIGEFITELHKVKLSIKYKGREFYMENSKEKGEALMLTIADEFSEKSKVEALPKLQGRNMFMVLSPKA